MKTISTNYKWLCIFILLPMTLIAQTNTEESKVPDYDLPELLLDSDGKRIKDSGTWEKSRRDGILKIFEEEVYGKMPLEKLLVETSEKVLDDMAFQGKATLSEITFTFKNNGKSVEAILLLILPNSENPAPVFLGYNFMGNHTVLTNELVSRPTGWTMNNSQLGIVENKATELSRGARYSRWPVLNLLARGYGLATMHYGDIDPDFDDGFTNGIHALFSKSDSRQPDAGGSIASWSWGLSRIMDYLETVKTINPEKVALFGHSRLGKAALWAGATDKRFSIVISNDSGCGGAALSRRRFGETISVINTSFPHWFCENFKKYNDKEGTMPFDQHQLLALIAPRPLYVASAINDSWADPKGEFLSLKHASEVYGLYDEASSISEDQPGENAPLLRGSLGYHIRTGNHNVTPYDWEQFMNFADLKFANPK